MKLYQLLLTLLIATISLNLNNCECLSTRVFKRSNVESGKTSLVLAPGLMLTTSDSISLIYPKELGYEKDFLHVIYKLNTNNDSNDSMLRIEDSVYDNQTWSIYCIISNSSGGTELIRLQHLVPFNRKKSLQNRKHLDLTTQATAIRNQFSYQIAANWSRSLIYKNTTTKLLNMDINVKKRKLYWFEFDTLTKKWSLVIKRLNNLSESVQYFTFDEYAFSNDGYSYISIAHDYEKRKQTHKNDIVLFVSNNQTLNICFLTNMTCEDYFRSPSPVKTPLIKSSKADQPVNEDDYDENDDDEEEHTDLDLNLEFDKTSREELNLTELRVEQPPPPPPPPLHKFGQLTGIYYDKHEHALYLSDYGNDRIEKITFDKDTTKRSDYKFVSLDTIFKSDHDQSPINPIMSVFYDSYIFWIDFEEGLKTTVFKSSCVRTIYKVKESTSLRFIQIGTFKSMEANGNGRLGGTFDQPDSANGLNRVVSIQEATSGLQYPPDYYNYNSNEEIMSGKNIRFNGLKSSAYSLRKCSILNLVFLIFVILL